MGDLAIFGTKLVEPLSARRAVTVELPKFLVRAIEARVEDANQDAPSDEEVSFNDMIEWLLVSEVTIRRMPHLETLVPGFSAAMASWLVNSTYSGPEDNE